MGGRTILFQPAPVVKRKRKEREGGEILHVVEDRRKRRKTRKIRSLRGKRRGGGGEEGYNFSERGE